ncbi:MULTISPECIES: phenylalanine--tRNA ligase subunit beta [Staphylococcus]|uniref:Phenylalanine--tRNA ligase beta subunit n=1 Tax=Staphylococcus agnetis TaxID=985762 RepID=A0A2T4MKK6_9STAP|nr:MULTISPECIES: phenylalanine--tRNA ligase subunit beta [Staphylococcus]NHM91430.1 phenylalanine--tRNA ligase subunit beta [Staphylococcus sp. 10602379]NJI03053.1 phenylalanine--tRNA ligase subunit beta [Staphylococcus agnetis]NJI13674.1 phenylalanine--tRNA ligase subunit beta [Staphylococcus agnetis]PTH15935.1 phenylalanine--tRNA ligase subunit beta [Staphylococcus agnetis]PTH30199.1 phenylalanine--tRNA ligase subunit beta [Staphylococcus agnetis]
MLISKEWLESYVDVDVSIEDLAERITRSGIEVDDIVDFTANIKNLVVGYVEAIQKHPDADKLNVCKVNIGETEPVQIVCGAPNVGAGQTVIVAKVGGRLPGGVKIKRAKLRGQVSEGMICSLQEIGLASNVVPKAFEEGIYNFSTQVEPGTDALKALYLDDQLMEFDLTPNRSDALSMIGTAYEVGALYHQPVQKPDTSIKVETGHAQDELTVKILNDDKVPYYSARIVKNVRIAPSPEWMQARLMKAGIRPINNVVDISNYVLLEYGQPLHMFDQDQIGSNEIVVRQAREGETMTTLDDQERQLQENDIVITNGEQPIALGGVMGGDFSEVTDQTTNVVVEGALFDPVAIRHTSRRLNLRSESSSRFEKGLATEFVNEAVDRACHLLEVLAGGSVMQGRVSQGYLGSFTHTIDITVEKVNRTIGFNVSESEMIEALEQLGFKTSVANDTLQVIVPSRRPDIKIEADIIEEIARIYGYDNLPSSLPVFETVTSGALTDRQRKTRVVRHVLEGAGLSQAITYSLVDEKRATAFTTQSRDVIKLLMPMSEAHSTLRQSLIPHLIDAAQYNVARKNQNIALYEIGNVFFSNGEGQLPDEVEYLSGIMTGDYVANPWQGKKEVVDFYLTKGVVDRIADKLALSFDYETAKIDGLHPGRTAKVLCQGEVIGFIGELHPSVAKTYDLGRTYVFELNYEKIMTFNVGYINYSQIPKFPGVTRDIALVVDTEVRVSSLIHTIENTGGRLLKQASVFDVYEGEHMEAGKKSVAIRLEYLDTENTLTEAQVAEVHEGILRALEHQGATLRG